MLDYFLLASIVLVMKSSENISSR